jgi:hypothetical protein
MSATYDRELEDELELETEDESLAGSIREGELEDEHELEDEYEAEEELEGAFEDELAHELMGEFEDEYEIEGEDEAFFGGLAKLAGSLLGEGEHEWATADSAWPRSRRRRSTRARRTPPCRRLDKGRRYVRLPHRTAVQLSERVNNATGQQHSY